MSCASANRGEVWLVDLGYAVTSEQGFPDELLWEKIPRENRLLITKDKGFAGYRSLYRCFVYLANSIENLARITARAL